MDYELAKKLKDAGFPDIQEMKLENEEHTEIRYYMPTLSELIEACGYGFRQLVLHTEYNKNRETIGRVWMAKAGKKYGGFLKSGHNPEEAVAELWLKLNR